VDPSGDVLVTGGFWDKADFDPGDGVDDRTSIGFEDAFVSRFDPSGTFKWAGTWGGGPSLFNLGRGIGIDPFGIVFVTGYFQATADLDPGTGVDNHTSSGDSDVFLVRL